MLPKEKAEEKYTDAIASGNTGILSTMDKKGKSYIMNVGNVIPKERVVLNRFLIRWLLHKLWDSFF